MFILHNTAMYINESFNFCGATQGASANFKELTDKDLIATFEKMWKNKKKYPNFCLVGSGNDDDLNTTFYFVPQSISEYKGIRSICFEANGCLRDEENHKQ